MKTRDVANVVICAFREFVADEAMILGRPWRSARPSRCPLLLIVIWIASLAWGHGAQAIGRSAGLAGAAGVCPPSKRLREDAVVTP